MLFESFRLSAAVRTDDAVPDAVIELIDPAVADVLEPVVDAKFDADDLVDTGAADVISFGFSLAQAASKFTNTMLTRTFFILNYPMLS